MTNSTTKLKNILFALFIICFAILFSPAKAETCGICKDSYLSCISGGGSSSSCERQLRSCQAACGGGDIKDSGGVGLGLILKIFIVFIAGLFAYFYLSTLLSEKREKREIKEEKERRSRMTPEEIAKEQEEIAIKESIAVTQELRKDVLSKLQNMTVDEITEFTKSSKRSTTSWLTRNGYTCKDFDGAAKKDALIKKID